MSGELHYPEAFIAQLHLRWGEGFLSPGGPAEVLEIVRGLDLAGKRVLDIGCGTGGPALVLARETGAEVVGIDIEPQLLARARKSADRAGVAVEWRLVEPGPLPFEEAAFDLVFSKDALIHVRDKGALFREVGRVLKPGGVFAASDWLAGENAAGMPAMRRWLELSSLDVALATVAETEAAIRAAGFEAISTRDRTAWYATLAAGEVAALEARRAQLAAASTPADVNAFLARIRANAEAAAEGSLCPTHLRASKPGARS